MSYAQLVCTCSRCSPSKGGSSLQGLILIMLLWRFYIDLDQFKMQQHQRGIIPYVTTRLVVCGIWITGSYSCRYNVRALFFLLFSLQQHHNSRWWQHLPFSLSFPLLHSATSERWVKHYSTIPINTVTYGNAFYLASWIPIINIKRTGSHSCRCIDVSFRFLSLPNILSEFSWILLEDVLDYAR